MDQPASRTRRIGLVFISVCLALVFGVVVAVSALLIERQQSEIGRKAQRIFDVAMPMVFEATRMIRGLERLARDGESILWIEDRDERTKRRMRLQTIMIDAALQGDSATRMLIDRSFQTLDQNLADMAANGQTARARSLKRWEPIQLALLSASEAVGAQVSTAASDEADSIVETAGMASRIIFWINASLVVMTVIASVLVFLLVTRPILRLAQSLDSVRRGGSMTPARVYVRELDVLNNAAVELARAHSELEVARGQLDHMAHTDVLTGLANRRMFEMRARSEFERGQRYAESLSVVVFDIDHFKQINDEYSHEAGDAVLSALGAYLLSTSRNADLPPARIGGEEFALLLPHTTLDAARDAAERIRVGIIQLQIPVNQTATLRFTASFGVACCGPQDQNFQDTLRRADKALYLAKKAGRNRIEAAA